MILWTSLVIRLLPCEAYGWTPKTEPHHQHQKYVMTKMFLPLALSTHSRGSTTPRRLGSDGDANIVCFGLQSGTPLNKMFELILNPLKL